MWLYHATLEKTIDTDDEAQFCAKETLLSSASNPVDLSGSGIWKETRHFFKIQLNLKFHPKKDVTTFSKQHKICESNYPKKCTKNSAV